MLEDYDRALSVDQPHTNRASPSMTNDSPYVPAVVPIGCAFLRCVI
jgi:hypothetical protein